MSVRIITGNCLDIMPTLAAGSIDSVITDPPYGLNFMGKDWDHGVPGEHFWREALRVAKPGAHLLAFGGTRTHHRLMVAIEDAGWELRDCVMWIYGSGFPKSLDVSKAIDRGAGAGREVLGVVASNFRPNRSETTAATETYGRFGNDNGATLTAPATDAARQWQGWGTALKPAWEPIIVARKPFKGSVAANVLKHGTGALNIDGCRIDGAGPTAHGGMRVDGAWVTNKGRTDNYVEHQSGRWPANLIHDGSEEVVALFPENLVTAIVKCVVDPITHEPKFIRMGESPIRGVPNEINTSGRWPANVCHDGSDEVVALFPETSSGSLTPDQQLRGGYAGENPNCYGTAARGGTGSYEASAGSAARFFYCAKSSRHDRNDGTNAGSGNGHPTVKPTDLMRWLCRLVTPPLVWYCDSCEGEHNDSTKTEGRVTSLRELRPGVQASRQSEGGTILQPGVLGSSAGAADETVCVLHGDVPAEEGRSKSPEHLLQSCMFSEGDGPTEAQSWWPADSERLHPDSCARSSNGEPRGLCDAAPPRNGRDAGPRPPVDGGRSPHQRGQDRQPSRELGTDAEDLARPSAEAQTQADPVSALPRADRSQRTCPTCKGALKQRAGVVLDPFMGSGSTLKAAELEGFSAIGIELEQAYADIAARRISSDAPLFAEVTT